jgi:hypothetical protein
LCLKCVRSRPLGGKFLAQLKYDYLTALNRLGLLAFERSALLPKRCHLELSRACFLSSTINFGVGSVFNSPNVLGQAFTLGTSSVLELLQLNLERIARTFHLSGPIRCSIALALEFAALSLQLLDQALQFCGSGRSQVFRPFGRCRVNAQLRNLRPQAVALLIQGVTLCEQSGALTDNSVLGLAPGMVQRKGPPLPCPFGHRLRHIGGGNTRLAVSRQAWA